MVDPFESPMQLLAWAKSHVDAIVKILDEFNAPPPYEFVEREDAASGALLVNIRVTRPIPSDISLHAFDAVNAIRASLDQAMYASTFALKRDVKNTKFPFGNVDQDSVVKDLKRKPHDMHPAIVELAVKAGACQTGNKLLWEMNQLRNLKHHRFIAARASRATGLTISGDAMGLRFPKSKWNPETQEMSFAEVTNFFKGDMKADIAIVFAEDAPFAREPIVGIFDHLLEMTRGIIMGIKAETERLLREHLGA